MSEFVMVDHDEVEHRLNAEEMDMSTEEGREAFLDSQFVVAVDHLQKCNSCGHVRRHSSQTPCPNGQHGRAGWSYAGPIPDAVDADTDALLEEHFAGIDVHNSVIKGTFDALLSLGHSEPLAREMISKALYTGRKFSSVSEMMDAIYNPGSEIPDAGEESESEREEAIDQLAREIETAALEAFIDPTSIAVEKAIMRMFEVQDRLDAAVEDHAEKADVAKTAKKRVESLQEDLSVAVKAVRQARSASDPDPSRYPLLDGPRAAKDEVNGLFSKPEAVQPLPPDDAEEFYRRKKRDARFADMPFKPKIIEILNGAGYHTVLDLDKLHEAGADITTIRCDAGSITEKRAEDIRLFLGSLAESWVEEWAETHPETSNEAD